MKRLIYFVAVACVALVGCTKNEALAPTEGTSDQLITFTSPVVGVATKGIPTVEYPSTEKFHVVGKLHKGTYNGTWNTYTTYMNTDVKLVGGEWVPVNDSDVAQNYYWPKGDDNYNLSFIAYAPSTATVPTINESGITWSDYIIAPGSTSVDLLYSHRTYNKTESNYGTNNISGYDYSGTPYSGVNILFEHALSSINFDVKTDADYGTTISLTGITLNNIAKQGTFSQGISDAAVTGDGILIYNNPTPWELPSPEVVDTYKPFTGTQLLSTTAYEIAPLYLIPQPLQDSKTVTITYTIKNPEGVTVPCTKTVELNDYSVTSWERGKKYIYHITIGLKRIYFAPEVVEWVDVTADNISI